MTMTDEPEVNPPPQVDQTETLHHLTCLCRAELTLARQDVRLTAAGKRACTTALRHLAYFLQTLAMDGVTLGHLCADHKRLLDALYTAWMPQTQDNVLYVSLGSVRQLREYLNVTPVRTLLAEKLPFKDERDAGVGEESIA